jgi:predicted nucleic acid-binding protein
MTPGTLRTAAAFDERYADLNLGLVDAAVMAIADRERAPILTFDFKDFRATARRDGSAWPLVVDEAAFARLTAR